MSTEIRWLRDALERTDVALRDVLAGKSVRDADEILSSNAFLLFASPFDGAQETGKACQHANQTFDRSFCACGWMHTYCTDCGDQLEPCDGARDAGQT